MTQSDLDDDDDDDLCLDEDDDEDDDDGFKRDRNNDEDEDDVEEKEKAKRGMIGGAPQKMHHVKKRNSRFVNRDSEHRFYSHQIA